ncbi:putative protein FAF-like, chloroplastic [Iris pallida]|uniref:FAF domain-containing protein n=1 Tax=Iris pallida TaxID=29817 RepID=A0AAX6FGC2_IRIPA|nr:putative protein FAF-like, chloroplastic [Iris pallida]
MGRRSPSRSFPPPLRSISSRDGPCVQMRPRREDGRLVVEAVAVPSQNYLHARRQGGRLLLSFINTTTPKRSNIINMANQSTPEQAQELGELPEQEVVDEEEEAELEEEEEVEVVDRGTVVEVKVSTQPPQQQGGGAAAARVHRSSIVINKFVSCTSLGRESDVDRNDDAGRARTTSPRRSSAGTTTTTAAAAAVAASSLGGTLPARRRPAVRLRQQAAVHVEEEEQGGAAPRHEEVQPAQEAALHLGAMLHCYFLVKLIDQ